MARPCPSVPAVPLNEAIRAAGGVVRREVGDGHEFVVIHRANHGDWTLPKGKVEEGEFDEDASIREIEEETGLTCVLGPELPAVSYADSMGRAKRVRYWLASPLSTRSFIANAEVDDLRWLGFAEVRDLLTFNRDRSVVEASLALDRPVYLVRHARAGSSMAWRGADGLRPITEKGLRQALRLGSRLGSVGAGPFISSPALRCVQTLEPLAAEAGVVVRTAPELADDAPVPDVDRFLRRLPGPIVVCSHGKPIEAVLAAWAMAGVSVDGPLREGAPIARKGSTWVVERRAGEPVALRYLPPPRDRAT